MSRQAKILFGVTMSLALLAGFIHAAWPDAPVSFKRIHIFGFNLLTGGSLILYHLEGKRRLTPRIRAYFALAFLYAGFASVGWYVPALVLSVFLFGLVESLRIERFGFFPWDFFRPVKVSEKFYQASMLCLSIAILFASAVILNNAYGHWVSYEKLTLDVFFLGYSFPVSLVTMGIMFSFLDDRPGPVVSVLKEIAFWSVNVGVIVFFVFIIFELPVAEAVAATTLSVTVVMIFIVFLRDGPPLQQKTFLLSGMAFLLFTAITGVIYILQYAVPALAPYRELFLVLHAMVSLYGWNLSGLFIIVRWDDFPIELNSAVVIALHWAIVLVLAPLGKYLLPVSIVATLACVALLAIVFSTRGRQPSLP